MSYKYQIEWVIKAIKSVCMYWVQNEGIWDSLFPRKGYSEGSSVKVFSLVNSALC